MRKELTTLAFLLPTIPLALLWQTTAARANPIPCCTFDVVRDGGDRSPPLALELAVVSSCIEVPSDEFTIVLRRNGEVIEDVQWASAGSEDGIVFRYVDSDVSGGFYWYEVSANIGETPCDLQIGVIVDSDEVVPPLPEGGIPPVDAGKDVQDSPTDPESRDGGQSLYANRDGDETNSGGSGGCSVFRSPCRNNRAAVAVVIFITGIITLRLRRKQEGGLR